MKGIYWQGKAQTDLSWNLSRQVHRCGINVFRILFIYQAKVQGDDHTEMKAVGEAKQCSLEKMDRRSTAGVSCTGSDSPRKQGFPSNAADVLEQVILLYSDMKMSKWCWQRIKNSLYRKHNISLNVSLPGTVLPESWICKWLYGCMEPSKKIIHGIWFGNYLENSQCQMHVCSVNLGFQIFIIFKLFLTFAFLPKIWNKAATVWALV